MTAFVPAPGAVVADKYRLDQPLGKGAMGAVWRATQLALDRPVAIKLLHVHVAAREEAAVRFSREARVAASLVHPSSVAVLDFGEFEGTLYLVMELVTGTSLRERMQREPPSFVEAISIARHVATALAAAHQIRLVHRDIKPENVILPAGHPAEPAKVVDFGLAFIVDADVPQQMGRMTADGSVAGTPAYMSPEQVRGGSIGPPSDVYSLGCMLYELIAGKPPFTGAVGEILTRHAYAPPIALRQLELAEAPPAAVDELVQAMLSKSPSARPTASRVASALAAYATKDADRAGRSSMPVIERQQRAVPRSAEQTTGELEAEVEQGFAVGVLHPLPEELGLALAAAGIQVTEWPRGEVGREEIVFAEQATVDQLAALVGAGKNVLADIEAADATQLPALIHAGVADAIVRPHDPDALVRRLWRSHRLARQRP